MLLESVGHRLQGHSRDVLGSGLLFGVTVEEVAESSVTVIRGKLIDEVKGLVYESEE